MRIKRDNRGFTLLEVVVAVAVLTIGMAVALQIFSGGMNNIQRITDANRAIMHAENVMNEILADKSVIGPFQDGGDLDDDFYYQAQVDYWSDADSRLIDPELFGGIDLLAVTVDVHFKAHRRGRTYRLFCLKTVSQEPLGQPGAGGQQQ